MEEFNNMRSCLLASGFREIVTLAAPKTHICFMIFHFHFQKIKYMVYTNIMQPFATVKPSINNIERNPGRQQQQIYNILSYTVTSHSRSVELGSSKQTTEIFSSHKEVTGWVLYNLSASQQAQVLSIFLFHINH